MIGVPGTAVRRATVHQQIAWGGKRKDSAPFALKLQQHCCPPAYVRDQATIARACRMCTRLISYSKTQDLCTIPIETASSEKGGRGRKNAVTPMYVHAS